MSTYMASASNIERKWYVVDAADYTLGRLASQVRSSAASDVYKRQHHRLLLY